MFRPLLLILLIILSWNSSSFAQTTFAVPNIPGVCGVSGVIVNMSGGSGGASNSSGTGFPDGGAGGHGGSVICTLNVITPTVITSLTYYVGMAGATGFPVYSGTLGALGGTGYGNGGHAGNFAGPTGGVGTDVSGGGGGGSSAVLNTTGGTVLLVAGGGGGGGGLSTTVYGGAAGNPGASGGSYSPNFGGSGGTPGAFGAAGGAGIAYAGMPGGAAPGNGGNGGEGLTGSQSGGGGGAGYGGGGGGGAGNTAFAGVNTVTGGGGGGSNYVNPADITTGLINGAAATTGNGAVSLVLYPAIATTTGVTFCAGNTSTFTETTPGGVWSSSNAAIASVSSATGTSVTVTGVSAGVADISYTAAAGYFSFVTVTVSAGASPIAGTTTVCATQTSDLTDTASGGTWSSSAAGIASVSATGTITGVSAGSAVITYDLPSGCYVTVPVTVNPFPTPIAGPMSICGGSTTTLTDGVPGGTWASSNSSVATIDPSSGLISGLSAGTTTITYGFTGGCLKTTVVTVNPLPDITGESSTGPTTCGGTDGEITLDGLAAGTSYLVNYDYNGSPVPTLTLPANADGQLYINSPSTGLLDTGTYTNIQVTNAVTGCVSNIVGPITLYDPPTPPAPVITASQPLCLYQTLFLTAADAAGTGVYTWTGPNGYTSTSQDPTIVAANYADTGVYSVIFTQYNCVSTAVATDVTIVPPPQLTNVTINQTIPYGGTVHLNADNAYHYMWTPDNGTLNNTNINDPIATPLVTTTYTVYGMSLYGCLDSATVTITVDDSLNGSIPNAFSPNNDGLNDVFRPIGAKFQRLVDFRIYNRWGQQIFYSNSIDKGWDGTFNGVPQDVGEYYYVIIASQPATDENQTYKGDVILIR